MEEDGLVHRGGVSIDLANDEQFTGFTVEDMSDGDGMGDDIPLLPTGQFDPSVSSLAQDRVEEDERIRKAKEAGDARARDREERRMATGAYIVYRLKKWGLMPARWYASTLEEGMKYPWIVYVVNNNYRRWGKSAMSAITFVATILWLTSYFMGTPSRVTADGVEIVNVWEPSKVHDHDMTSVPFVLWLTENRHHVSKLSKKHLRKEYFEASVFDAGEVRNVTFSWIEEALDTLCKDCACAPAIELGILANVIMIPTKTQTRGMFMLNPVITTQSDKLAPVKFEDGTTTKMPLAVKVEFLNTQGMTERRVFEAQQSFCIVRSLGLVGMEYRE